MRKMIHIATASLDALEALAAESGKTFQDLIDEAVADLLKKTRPFVLDSQATKVADVVIGHRLAARQR